MSRTKTAALLCEHCLAAMVPPGSRRIAQDPASPNHLLPYRCGRCAAQYGASDEAGKGAMEDREARNRTEWGCLK